MYIDIEGGWGGSSRSLFHLIEKLDRKKYNPLVIHRRSGPNEKKYKMLNIPTIKIESIFSFAPRKNKSFKNFIANMPDLLQTARVSKQLTKLIQQYKIDIIHLNYEGLFYLGKRLKKMTGLPVVFHSRTLIPKNKWGSWVAKTIANSASHVFFISDNEKQRFASLTKSQVPSNILWNITYLSSEPKKLCKQRNIVYLGNLDYIKGPDRLIALAEKLKVHDVKNCQILIYGTARNTQAYQQAIEKNIQNHNLSQYIKIMGFTESPETVLDQSFVLLRPSRENDPWGRDVIEAIARGTPVIASGNYNGIVSNGETGFLVPEFDISVVYEKLMTLLNDITLWQRMSDNCIKKARLQHEGSVQRRLLDNAYQACLKHAY